MVVINPPTSWIVLSCWCWGYSCDAKLHRYIVHTARLRALVRMFRVQRYICIMHTSCMIEHMYSSTCTDAKNSTRTPSGLPGLLVLCSSRDCAFVHCLPQQCVLVPHICACTVYHQRTAHSKLRTAQLSNHFVVTMSRFTISEERGEMHVACRNICHSTSTLATSYVVQYFTRLINLDRSYRTILEYTSSGDVPVE